MADKSVPYRSAHGAFWVLPFQFRSFACSSKTEQCHNGWCSNALESWIVYSHVAMQAPRTIKLKCYLQRSWMIWAPIVPPIKSRSHTFLIFFASVLELQPALCRAVLKHGQVFICCHASSCENEHQVSNFGAPVHGFSFKWSVETVQAASLSTRTHHPLNIRFQSWLTTLHSCPLALADCTNV